MRTLVLISVLLAPLLGRALQLDLTTPSTNNATLFWYSWTNGQALRYDAYWTAKTNKDTGTNWATTTNWVMFLDVGPSVTNGSMRLVPTNSYITMIYTIPGGHYTYPLLSNNVPYTYWYSNVLITNQPASP